MCASKLRHDPQVTPVSHVSGTVIEGNKTALPTAPQGPSFVRWRADVQHVQQALNKSNALTSTSFY